MNLPRPVALVLLATACQTANTDDTSAPQVDNGTPDFRVAPSVLDFGEVTVLDTTYQTLTVINLGDGDGHVYLEFDVPIVEAWDADPRQADVLASEYLDIEVSFKAEAWANHRGMLRVIDQDNEEVAEVELDVSVDSR